VLGGDELRDRLLAGYRHILVDEYQDIDQRQYELVSAVAGRSLADDEARLTILAVGDDDQNIYTFRGANVAFIRRFEQDYQARFHYLVENFRSTAHIIAAANCLISRNRDRMKIEQPILVNSGRAGSEPPGGTWAGLDPLARGRVQVLRVADRAAQAAAICQELQRLQHIDPAAGWPGFAVLARTHQELAILRASLEFAGIPVVVAGPGLSLPIGRIREINLFMTDFPAARPGAADKRPGGLAEVAGDLAAANPWWALLTACLHAWHEESGDAELAVVQAIDFLWEALVEQKREGWAGRGVFLSTVHGAKGTEFDHVLVADGGWRPRPDAQDEQEEERRAYYMAMTRARQTLCLLERADDPNPHTGFLRRTLTAGQLAARAPEVEEPLPAHVLQRRYQVLGLKDLFLDYTGRCSEQHPIHRRLRETQTGDPLRFRLAGAKLELVNQAGKPLARLAEQAAATWMPLACQVESLKVLAMIERRAEDVQRKNRQALLVAPGADRGGGHRGRRTE
jgi:ATP-dependent DNA helicase RecQ